MVLLGDKAQVECCFGPFGDSVSVGARLVHGLREIYHRLINHFVHTQLNSKVTWVMWNLASFRLEIVLVSVQDWRMVYARRTIGSEIILDALHGATR